MATCVVQKGYQNAVQFSHKTLSEKENLLNMYESPTSFLIVNLCNYHIPADHYSVRLSSCCASTHRAETQSFWRLGEFCNAQW